MVLKPELQLDEKKERQYRPEIKKIFDENKGVLDRLGKKETTDKDIKDFMTLIENNIIMKIVNDLNYWLRQPDLEDYSNDYVLRDLKSKYQKLLKL